MGSGELDNALSERNIGFVGDLVGTSSKSPRRPQRTQQQGHTGKRGQSQLPGNGKQRQPDGQWQQDRRDQRRQQVDHQSHQFGPAGGDRLTGGRRVVCGEPVQSHTGQPVCYTVLGMVEHSETQLETDACADGIDHPPGYRRSGQPAQPHQRLLWGAAEQGTNERNQQHRADRADHNRKHPNRGAQDQLAAAVRRHQPYPGADHRSPSWIAASST
ncbi:hypothetical protein MSHO_61700 [Mycobacterium shottsii]|uniref:Uncharacterized protein n=1 Tax=Mycobacterium shottsii TaxID=133549 RepID=A0A7I7LLT1_9MYCO|nr:hypothetical protein MSHO_61700 [Mycobacterium shottsii]